MSMTIWGMLLAAMLSASITLSILFYRKQQRLSFGVFSLMLCSVHLLTILITNVIITVHPIHYDTLKNTAESILLFSLIIPVIPLIGFILAIIELIKKNRNIPAAIAAMFLHYASVHFGILYAFDLAISYISSC